MSDHCSAQARNDENRNFLENLKIFFPFSEFELNPKCRKFYRIKTKLLKTTIELSIEMNEKLVETIILRGKSKETSQITR